MDDVQWTVDGMQSRDYWSRVLGIAMVILELFHLGPSKVLFYVRFSL